MAKARRIPGLGANDPYAAAAAKILAVRVRELLDHAGGVLDIGDIERVHDMRVATRRLRAALEVFAPCFPRAELKAGLGEVKALADALGERRDRDVAIGALGDVAASLSAPDRPGVQTLIARLRSEQAAANDALALCVSENRLASLHEQLLELVASAETISEGDRATIEISRQQDRSDNGTRGHAGG